MRGGLFRGGGGGSIRGFTILLEVEETIGG